MKRLLIERLEKHQVLIFVHSRKETVQTAEKIHEELFKDKKEGLLMDPQGKDLIIIKEISKNI